MRQINQILADLQDYTGESSFNPWSETNDLDISADAPKIRTNNLKKYLKDRKSAKFLLIAEGLSYQGGRFSGLAMTSERQVINDKENLIFKGKKQRTSNPNCTEKKTIRELGFTENTGTIVWKTLTPLMKSTNWITWNIFPWHPHKAEKFLSNRLPREDEITAGLEIFKKHFDFLAKNRVLISVGKTAGNTLEKAGYKTHTVRHPANGGGAKFKSQIEEIIKSQNKKPSGYVKE